MVAVGVLFLVLGSYMICHALVKKESAEKMRQALARPTSKNVGRIFHLFLGSVLVILGLLAVARGN